MWGEFILVDPDVDALNELRTWLEELNHLMRPNP